MSAGQIWCWSLWGGTQRRLRVLPPGCQLGPTRTRLFCLLPQIMLSETRAHLLRQSMRAWTRRDEESWSFLVLSHIVRTRATAISKPTAAQSEQTRSSQFDDLS